MDEREKVFHGLESCSCDAGVPNLCEVTGCPYRGDAMCQHNLIRDALELLKAQDKVITALLDVGYPHNFQREEPWIVNYMYAITDVIREAVRLRNGET